MARLISRVSPILGVPDVRRSAEYFRDYLGFTLDPVDGVFQPPGSEPGGLYAIVKLGEAWIHFQIRHDFRLPARRSGLERDLYLYVNNLDEFHADVRERGASILQEPHTMPYGIREFVIEDPNGYRIAFGQAV